jgi:hypothetical protein
MSFDVFMIKFDEPETDANWSRLLSAAPHATLIQGVPGIRAAHLVCAQRAHTSHFFVVDGDNWLLDEPIFDINFTPSEDEVVVWRARNPVNGLIYGHGAVKFMPSKAAAGAMNGRSIDLATSLTPRYRIVPILASEHRFNVSPLLAWRTAFRECAKLASRLTRGPIEPEAAHRLTIWCSVANGAQNSQWCQLGAHDGRDFGTTYASNQEKLEALNDYSWLQKRFIKAEESFRRKFPMSG